MSAPLALTMGDPAGIGPEICIRALGVDALAADVVIFGAVSHLRSAAAALSSPMTINPISEPAERAGRPGVIDVVDLDPPRGRVALGQVSAAGGQAAYDAIVAAVESITAGATRALVTAPINKESLRAAGVPFPGHTEMLASLAGAGEVSMMLYNSELRVVLVTVHVALREAIAALSVAGVLRAIRMAAAAGAALGIRAPRVAVAGLNPHAGEGGLFGDEERTTIAPAIAIAREEGLDVHGPLPGDTVFMEARDGRYDIVVAQYHDQGLIPIKYLGLDEGVNVTLGLPFIRTSVDHGTAFAIAGQGVASAQSLVTAVRAAQLLSERGPVVL